MSYRYTDRMRKQHRSFVKEILAVTETPEVISFAGGLPNPSLFPVKEIAEAAEKVLRIDGQVALQYATTQGYPPLREFIAQRYREKDGMNVSPDEIIITSGSQQGMDLVAKLFLDRGDGVIIESPSYHVAIQAFAMFQPVFQAVPLLADGIDPELLAKSCAAVGTKLFYAEPTFQNPSGLTYSNQRRMEVASIIGRYDIVLVEDDPYGSLRFQGEHIPPIWSYAEKAILLSTFSKIVAPGLRLGWACADREVIQQMVYAKQATDLHTSYFDQRVLYQYLIDNDVDAHIVQLASTYKKQRDQMVSCIAAYCPPEIHYTEPDGGMFLWLTLPEGLSAMRLFQQAADEKVAFVPGQAFHPDGSGDNALRLSYSTSDEATIEEGIKRLGKLIARELAEAPLAPVPRQLIPEANR